MDPPCRPGSSTPEPPILVVGFGNPLRGDDAVGPLAAEQLAVELASRDVEVLCRHSLTVDLASRLATAELAIFLDASLDGRTGDVVCRRLRGEPTSNAVTHQLTPQELLAWCEQLFGRAPPTYLICTRAVSFELADCRLTAPVAAAVPDMIRETRNLIDGYCGDVRSGRVRRKPRP